MSPAGEQPLQYSEDAGDIDIGVEHGPEPAPLRRIKVRSPDGTTAEQYVSEEAYQQLQALRQRGMTFLATTSRKAVRERRAVEKRERRRGQRARARQNR